MGMVTDGLNRLFSNDNPALRILRDVGLGLVDRLPPLRRHFIGARPPTPDGRRRVCCAVKRSREHFRAKWVPVRVKKMREESHLGASRQTGMS